MTHLHEQKSHMQQWQDPADDPCAGRSPSALLYVALGPAVAAADDHRQAAALLVCALQVGLLCTQLLWDL